jgi:hypothetical protein
VPFSIERRFAFIHIPKCAGTSISSALAAAGVHMDFKRKASKTEQTKFGVSWLSHVTAESLSREFDERTWRALYKFAFVRNPWDLSVSVYHYQRRRAYLLTPQEILSAKSVRGIAQNIYAYLAARRYRHDNSAIFAEFAPNKTFEEWIRARKFLRPCSSYICNTDGKSMMNYVGRFEDLKENFSTICERLKIDAKLPHLNRSAHGYYREYYNLETRAIVEEHFAVDIKEFGYEF